MPEQLLYALSLAAFMASLPLALGLLRFAHAKLKAGYPEDWRSPSALRPLDTLSSLAALACFPFIPLCGLPPFIEVLPPFAGSFPSLPVFLACFWVSVVSSLSSGRGPSGQAGRSVRSYARELSPAILLSLALPALATLAWQQGFPGSPAGLGTLSVAWLFGGNGLETVFSPLGMLTLALLAALLLSSLFLAPVKISLQRMAFFGCVAAAILPGHSFQLTGLPSLPDRAAFALDYLAFWLLLFLLSLVSAKLQRLRDNGRKL